MAIEFKTVAELYVAQAERIAWHLADPMGAERLNEWELYALQAMSARVSHDDLVEQAVEIVVALSDMVAVQLEQMHACALSYQPKNTHEAFARLAGYALAFNQG